MIHPNSFTVKSVHRHWMLCAHGLRCEAHGSFMDAFDDRNASRLCWLTNFWAICWPQIVKTICFPKKVTKNLFLMAGDYEWTEWSLQEERLDSKFWQIGKFRNHQQVQEFLKIETFSVFEGRVINERWWQKVLRKKINFSTDFELWNFPTWKFQCDLEFKVFCINSKS